MVHRFDFLVSNGGNSVLSDNLNILSNTLLIFLSLIVSKKSTIFILDYQENETTTLPKHNVKLAVKANKSMGFWPQID